MISGYQGLGDGGGLNINEQYREFLCGGGAVQYPD